MVLCGIRLGTGYAASNFQGPVFPVFRGCYDMSCYYVLFGCICFIQFHPATSDTVVTDDLCSHGLGWS